MEPNETPPADDTQSMHDPDEPDSREKDPETRPRDPGEAYPESESMEGPAPTG
jgi:hypothetical protein